MTTPNATPQAPQECPACGAPVLIQPDEYGYMRFSCNQIMRVIGGQVFTVVPHDCNGISFDNLVALRATVSQLTAEREQLTDKLENETGMMPSEGAATNEQIVEVVHMLKQQIGDAKEIINELTAELAEAKRYSDHLEHENAALVVLHSNAVNERDALTARAERAESELKRHREVMPCGHLRMLEVLNDGQMPECLVCWLARVENELTEARTRLAELQGRGEKVE